MRKLSAVHASIAFVVFLFTLTAFTLFIALQRTIRTQITSLAQQHIENRVDDVEATILSSLNVYRSIVQDIADRPIIVQGLLQPESRAGRIEDILLNTPVLRTTPHFTVYAFDGEPFVHTCSNFDIISKVKVEELIETRESLIFAKTIGEKAYWYIAVPILYEGLAEGVLLAEFPIENISPFFSNPDLWGDLRLQIEIDGKNVLSLGDSRGGVNIYRSIQSLGIDIHLIGTTAQIDAAYERIQEKVLILFPLVSVGIIIICIVLTLKIFVKPIVSLADSLSSFDSTQLPEQNPAPIAIREIDKLWRDFENMARRIHNSTKEREKINQELEKKIETRTLAFKEMAEKAEQSNAAKSEFLANMSHELRTPLNSILLLSQQIAIMTDPEDKRQFFAKTVNKSGKHLLQLINDLLDIAKIEAGKVELVPERLTLETFNTDLQSEMQPLADERGIALRIVIASGVPRELQIDALRLHQIIKNLLSNAIKFTSSGYVELRYSMVDSRRMRIEVEDTGIGIASDKIEHIFQSFEQADTSITRNYGGTGLGLSLCAKLATLFNGVIHVTSKEGKGSCFSVEFPIDPIFSNEETSTPELMGAEITQSEKNSSQVVPSSQGELSALIVDDDPDNIFSLRQVLEYKFPTILEAMSAKEAYSILKENPSMSVVFMDSMMPVISGDEAIKTIRESLPDLPIFAVSADVAGSSKQRCMDAGANGFIPKPVDLSELFAELKKIGL